MAAAWVGFGDISNHLNSSNTLATVFHIITHRTNRATIQRSPHEIIANRKRREGSGPAKKFRETK